MYNRIGGTVRGKVLTAAALVVVAFGAPIALESAIGSDEVSDPAEELRVAAIEDTQAGWDLLLDKERASGGCAALLKEGYKNDLCEQVLVDLAAQDAGTYDGRFDDAIGQGAE